MRAALADRFDADPTSAWDLDALRGAYDRAGSTPPTTSSLGELRRHDDEDEATFAARFHLVHEWRKFLFADPGLPEELLRPTGPAGWPRSCSTTRRPGSSPAADRFVARCLDRVSASLRTADCAA